MSKLQTATEKFWAAIRDLEAAQEVAQARKKDLFLAYGAVLLEMRSVGARLDEETVGLVANLTDYEVCELDEIAEWHANG